MGRMKTEIESRMGSGVKWQGEESLGHAANERRSIDMGQEVCGRINGGVGRAGLMVRD